MDAELKEAKEIIEETKRMIRYAMLMTYCGGGSEDHVLDALEGAWEEQYNSADNPEKLGCALLIALEMSIAWNDMVAILRDSVFHQDALASRILKAIWEE